MKTGWLGIGLVLLTASAASAAEVRLRSAVGCTSTVVRVADVAEVFADDARVSEALAEITLCPAPGAGGKRVLTQAEVRELLALSGVDRKTTTVTGSDAVMVTAEGALRPTGGKRPMVAPGVRQAVFQPEEKPKAAAKAAVSAPLAAEKASAAPPAVERGAIVTVSARAAGVRVTTSAKALESGASGETIGVELTDGKQRVRARVSGPQMVEVE